MNSPEPTPCFWLDWSDQRELYLRRYVPSGQAVCPVLGYHQARTDIGPAPDTGQAVPADGYTGDPRWPAECVCGYVFTDNDAWQVFTDRWLVSCDGLGYPQSQLPPGALFDATWWPWKGADGIRLAVVCPPAGYVPMLWHPDGPAWLGGEQSHPAPAWTRTGDPRDPPSLSISPSIEIGFQRQPDGTYTPDGPSYYHGHLRNGVLTPG